MKYLIWFILIAIALHFVNKFLSKYKFPKVGSLVFVSGAVKSGKSTFSVGLVLSRYRSIHRKWWIRSKLAMLFKKDVPEEPLIYSNIPLAVPYVPLTKDILYRNKRIRFGSVVFVDEATLLADSMLIKDTALNERLTLFNKLFGHYSHCGLIVYNSQTISDVHFSLKRSLGAYFYVHHIVSWIPFVNVCYVRECLYSDDDSTLVNTITKDAEMDMRKVLIRKSVWRKFDSIAFSSLTDDKPVADNVVVADSLKIKKITSFRDFKTIDKKYIDHIGDSYDKK